MNNCSFCHKTEQLLAFWEDTSRNKICSNERVIWNNCCKITKLGPIHSTRDSELGTKGSLLTVKGTVCSKLAYNFVPF